MKIKISKKEAKAVLHCLKTTTTIGEKLTLSMDFEERLSKLLNKK
jgi:hypothetical protein